jgi:hypothetical protein
MGNLKVRKSGENKAVINKNKDRDIFEAMIVRLLLISLD